jgi:hypothetical protein
MQASSKRVATSDSGMIRGRLNPALLVAPKDENWGRGGPRRVR